jgi:excisionase family DNA binding protein
MWCGKPAFPHLKSGDQQSGRNTARFRVQNGNFRAFPATRTNSEETMTSQNYVRTLTVRGAANYLGLSASTLNKLRCTGSGPVYFKLGRAVRYDPQDLDQWLAERRVGSTSETIARNGLGKSGL